MKENNKLVKLIDQAACGIKALNPTKTKDLKNLQGLLKKIDTIVTKISDDSPIVFEQIKNSACGATETLQKILQDKVKDTSKSIEAISEAISTIQDLIGHIDQDEPPLDSKPDQADSAVNAEDQSQQAAVIEEQQSYIVPEDDIPLILDFITESTEHLESSEAGLLDLEAKPGDKEVLNLIFRAFHTIKGMAGFLNLSEIGTLAHSAENLLDLARKGELALVGGNTDLIFESIDFLKKLISALSKAIEAGEAVSPQKELPGLMMKLKAAVDNKGISVANPQSQAEVEMPAEKLDKKLDKKLDEILEPEKDSAVEDKDSREKERRKNGDRRGGTDRRTGVAEEKIKVSTTRLDDLINMAGELAIAHLMVAEEANVNLETEYELNRKVVHQGKIVRELQELSMSMRMVPIAGVFQKMARLTRDLSRKAGKQINFVTSGEDTELDRSVVDKISDPLVHMVRNSIDHGVESPEDRVKAGKNPTGQVKLRAFHQAGNIVIEIEDDGKGLKKEWILQKAIDNGIVQAGTEMSDEEIFKLIFHAGLSTAQKITSISGRGVGMDVVKKNIDALHGKIDISSTPGKGTIFTIRMPLTMAIIDGQIITVGNDRYIIPINSIVSSHKPTAGQLSSVHGRGEMVMMYGRLTPLVRLYELFDVVPKTKDPVESLIVMVEEDGKGCCLLVDELQGQQQVVIKNLGTGIGKVNGVSGGAIMGDGKVSLILDIPGLIQLAQN